RPPAIAPQSTPMSAFCLTHGGPSAARATSTQLATAAPLLANLLRQNTPAGKTRSSAPGDEGSARHILSARSGLGTGRAAARRSRAAHSVAYRHCGPRIAGDTRGIADAATAGLAPIAAAQPRSVGVAGGDRPGNGVCLRLSRRRRAAVRRDGARRQLYPRLQGAAAGADDQRSLGIAVLLG